MTAAMGGSAESGESGLASFEKEFGALVTRYKAILYKEEQSTDAEDQELEELKIKMIASYASQKVSMELYDRFVMLSFNLLQSISDESTPRDELTAFYVVEETWQEMLRARVNMSTGFAIDEQDDSLSAQTQRSVRERLVNLGVLVVE